MTVFFADMFNIHAEAEDAVRAAVDGSDEGLEYLIGEVQRLYLRSKRRDLELVFNVDQMVDLHDLLEFQLRPIF